MTTQIRNYIEVAFWDFVVRALKEHTFLRQATRTFYQWTNRFHVINDWKVLSIAGLSGLVCGILGYFISIYL
ncbi:MAG: hypothetical protein GYA17_08515 [Chloroflexi bacterium]|nr:hypothetical protein [Chloroflexota bacterium]